MAGTLTPAEVTLYRWIADKYGPGRPGMTEGNPAAVPPVLPSFLNPELEDATREEVLNIIEGLGVTLDRTKRNQALTAIKSHLDDIRMRQRWATWHYLASPSIGSEANAGGIWAKDNGRLLVVTTNSGLFRVVGFGASPTTVHAATHKNRVQFTATGKCASIATDAFYYSGGDAGTVSTAGGWAQFMSIPGPTASGLIRKRLGSSWQIEDGDQPSDSDAPLGVAPAPGGTYTALFYANGRVTLLTTTQCAYSDNNCATWTTFSHGASPPAGGNAAASRNVVWATLHNGANSILIVGSGTSYTVSKDNGLSWTTYATPGGLSIYDIAAGGGEIAMVGSGASANAYVSTDGVSWSARNVPQDTWRIFIEDQGPTAMRVSKIYALTTNGVFVSNAS